MRMSVLLILAMAAGSASAAPRCKGSAEVIGKCFAVHGAYVMSADSGLILAPDHTPGYLGLESYSADRIPENLEQIWDKNYHNHIVGDFEVCPLKPKGRLPQYLRGLLCIESAKNLRVAKDDDELCKLMKC
jgi:hypothetical protein